MGGVALLLQAIVLVGLGLAEAEGTYHETCASDHKYVTPNFAGGLDEKQEVLSCDCLRKGLSPEQNLDVTRIMTTCGAIMPEKTKKMGMHCAAVLELQPSNSRDGTKDKIQRTVAFELFPDPEDPVNKQPGPPTGKNKINCRDMTNVRLGLIGRRCLVPKRPKPTTFGYYFLGKRGGTQTAQQFRDSGQAIPDRCEPCPPNLKDSDTACYAMRHEQRIKFIAEQMSQSRVEAADGLKAAENWYLAKDSAKMATIDRKESAARQTFAFFSNEWIQYQQSQKLKGFRNQYFQQRLPQSNSELANDDLYGKWERANSKLQSSMWDRAVKKCKKHEAKPAEEEALSFMEHVETESIFGWRKNKKPKNKPVHSHTPLVKDCSSDRYIQDFYERMSFSDVVQWTKNYLIVNPNYDIVHSNCQDFSASLFQSVARSKTFSHADPMWVFRLAQFAKNREAAAARKAAGAASAPGQEKPSDKHLDKNGIFKHPSGFDEKTFAETKEHASSEQQISNEDAMDNQDVVVGNQDGLTDPLNFDKPVEEQQLGEDEESRPLADRREPMKFDKHVEEQGLGEDEGSRLPPINERKASEAGVETVPNEPRH